MSAETTPQRNTSSHPAVVFLGGGNMAAALISGLRAQGWPADRLWVAERDAARRDWLARELGLRVAERAGAWLDEADAVVLAVKPQQMAEAVADLHPKPDTVIISIAAGIRIASLRAWLGDDAALVRCMPNTPALARAAATALYTPPQTVAPARELAQRILKGVGMSCWVASEEQLDAVTALSGSGPAYFFLLAEAMAEAGAALGLPPDIAVALARQTLIGSGRLLEAHATPVTELRQRVTSKGGTTEAALARLEKAGLRSIIEDALRAAATRSRELGATPRPG